jgi:hypothetical protein
LFVVTLLWRSSYSRGRFREKGTCGCIVGGVSLQVVGRLRGLRRGRRWGSASLSWLGYNLLSLVVTAICPRWCCGYTGFRGGGCGHPHEISFRELEEAERGSLTYTRCNGGKPQVTCRVPKPSRRQCVVAKAVQAAGLFCPLVEGHCHTNHAGTPRTCAPALTCRPSYTVP